jgi:hypothetical protein
MKVGSLKGRLEEPLFCKISLFLDSLDFWRRQEEEIGRIEEKKRGSETLLHSDLENIIILAF